MLPIARWFAAALMSAALVCSASCSEPSADGDGASAAATPATTPATTPAATPDATPAATPDAPNVAAADHLQTSAPVAAGTDNWPRFRGPAGVGVSDATDLPLAWSPDQNIVWKTELPGAGASSPIVWGDHVYLTAYTGYLVPGESSGNLDDLKRHLICIRRDDGEVLWNKAVEAELPEEERIRDHGYAANTPAADDERVYAFFGKSGVIAFDHQGNQLWKADVGSNASGWGTAASPVLYKDLVFVNASVESQSLVALDRRTGEEVWRARGINEAWNTPLVVTTKAGDDELVVATHGKVLAFEPTTGEQLWSCDTDITWYMVPCPIAADGVVYVLGGRSGIASLAIRAGGRGDVTETHRLWTSNKGSNVTSPVYRDGRLYWVHDQLGIAYCAQADTGELLYEERLNRAGQFYASALLAGGRLYYLNRSGRVFVVAATPQFELLGTNDLRDGGVFNASPAVAGNRLLLRSDKYLYCVGTSTQAEEPWAIDSQEDWSHARAEATAVEIEEGLLVPTGKTARFASKVRRFDQKRQASSMLVEQSPVWQNWEPIANLGPANLADAPVFLAIGPKNYWVFGRYGGRRNNKARQPFEPEPATLEGFDVPLQTTRWPHQFDAPGGLQKGLGGYHAWQSRDMVNWVHHGPVTEGFSRWVTSAEYKDGKVYIYYDYPNDQDPHVYVDEDLADGKPGRNMGLAVPDPSHGSDSGVIRDKEGKFHVIFEDWSPINASKRSWDSPLAGHAVSEDGVSNFKFLPPAVDNRTKDTGKIAQYKHPHWLQHPDWDTNIGKYHVHEPEQEAYGDWAAICVGSQYYLFGDYDPAGGHQMSVGWFTSSSLDKPFRWCDKIGTGHPDPDIGFAEGRFYLFTQQNTDYVSPGPWVEKVEARVGVDTDNDGKLDEWTDWTEVKETYDDHADLVKHVQKTPATLGLDSLPAGYGFGFELRMTDTTENKSKPIIDRVTLSFD